MNKIPYFSLCFAYSTRRMKTPKYKLYKYINELINTELHDPSQCAHHASI